MRCKYPMYSMFTLHTLSKDLQKQDITGGVTELKLGKKRIKEGGTDKTREREDLGSEGRDLLHLKKKLTLRQTLTKQVQRT